MSDNYCLSEESLDDQIDFLLPLATFAMKRLKEKEDEVEALKAELAKLKETNSYQ